MCVFPLVLLLLLSPAGGLTWQNGPTMKVRTLLIFCFRFWTSRLRIADWRILGCTPPVHALKARHCVVLGALLLFRLVALDALCLGVVYRRDPLPLRTHIWVTWPSCESAWSNFVAGDLLSSRPGFGPEPKRAEESLRHLTNFAVNKQSKDFQATSDTQERRGKEGVGVSAWQNWSDNTIRGVGATLISLWMSPSMLTRGHFANYEASLCFVHPGFMKMAQHLEESRPRRNQGQLDPFSTQQR